MKILIIASIVKLLNIQVDKFYSIELLVQA
jgi:hypothetical protein